MAEEVQRTPKGEEIPAPTRGEFVKNLEKAATPKPLNSERPDGVASVSEPARHSGDCTAMSIRLGSPATLRRFVP